MSSNPSEPPPLSPVKRALLEIRDLRARLDQAERGSNEAIAIVGMAMRLPGGVSDPDSFWSLLAEARDGLTDLPVDRWSADETTRLAADAETWNRIRRGGFIDHVYDFDADFFHVTPREAESLDPQHRLLLEVVSDALEQGGHAAHRLSHTATGVFLGLSNSDYGRKLLSDVHSVDAHATINSWSMAAGRLAYTLNLHGPALVVDTACSSSLVAVHLACQSLRMRECSLALVGAANVILSPELNMAFAKSGMLSPTGACKTFDQAADGYVRAEGCGAVVLKRLSDAVAANDRILAVLRGSAVNHDGRSAGITAPNGTAQELVLREALRRAGVEPSAIDYVEAHGTGTALGDPIELEALARVYGPARERPLWIGSLKTNVGHMEAAAGLGGLLKTVLALIHEAIPPHLHFETGTRHLDWNALPLRVPASAVVWPRTAQVRRAGVSSFGFSGTNAHLIVEEAPAPLAVSAAHSARPAEMLCLSAATRPALTDLAQKYRTFLAKTGDAFPDICFTAAVGRSHHRERLALRASSATEAAAQLAEFQAHVQTVNARPSVVFVLRDRLGPSPDLARLGTDWSAHYPVFREALAQCLTDGVPRTAATTVFGAQYALARLWLSWGIEPQAVLGQGGGEFAAAAIAGIVPVEDALRLLQAPDGRAALGVSFSRPHIAIVSSRTGQVENESMSEASYWSVRNASSRHFATGLRTLAQNPAAVFLEIGSGASEPGDRTITSLSLSESNPAASLLTALGQLYCAGVDIDWKAFYAEPGRRLVSLPTYAFQRRTYRDPLLSPASDLAGQDEVWAQTIRSAKRASLSGPLGWDVRQFPAKTAFLARLTVAQIQNVFANQQAFAQTGEVHTAATLIAHCQFSKAHTHLMERWLSHLAEAGLLERLNGSYRALAPLTNVALAPYWTEADLLFVGDAPALTYLRRSSALLEDVLAGRVSPLETLFPEGDFTLSEDLYKNSQSAQYLNPIVAAAVETAARGRGPNKARILELGAGTGGTTSALLERLEPARTEYWFTDVSDVFLARAEREFAQYSFVRYARIDLDQPATASYRHAFDVVVAANVVHASKDLRESLRSIEQLLAPGGLLVLLESTRHFEWFDVTTGLIEGWQHFHDDLRRGHPLLAAQQWTDLLGEMGFREAMQFPEAGSLAEQVGQHVILARAPHSGAARTDHVALDHMASAPSAETPVAGDLFAALTESTPDDRFDLMLDHVQGCLRRVFRLAPGTVLEPRAHFTDLGMDSLLALELKAELGKGLPLAQLSASVAFDTGTPEALTLALLSLLFPLAPPSPAAEAPLPVVHTQHEVEALSDQEVEQLLVARLEAQRR